MPEIRAAGPQDADALVALWGLCGLTRPWNDPRRDIDRKLALGDGFFVLAEAGGAVVGSAMYGYDGHRGAVYYLAVHPAHRGRGLARRLLDRAGDDLRAVGCPKMNIVVRADNAEVAAFYRRLGFAEEHRLNFALRLIDDRA